MFKVFLKVLLLSILILSNFNIKAQENINEVINSAEEFLVVNIDNYLDFKREDEWVIIKTPEIEMLLGKGILFESADILTQELRVRVIEESIEAQINEGVILLDPLNEDYKLIQQPEYKMDLSAHWLNNDLSREIKYHLNIQEWMEFNFDINIENISVFNQDSQIIKSFNINLKTEFGLSDLFSLENISPPYQILRYFTDIEEFRSALSENKRVSININLKEPIEVQELLSFFMAIRMIYNNYDFNNNIMNIFESGNALEHIGLEVNFEYY